MALGMNDKEIVIRLDGWFITSSLVFIVGLLVIMDQTHVDGEFVGLMVCLLILCGVIPSVGRNWTKGRDSSADHS